MDRDTSKEDNISTSTFFKAGGTLNTDTPSYVVRTADAELFEAIQTGEFCYILTTRQMGKSSLMVRTAERLEKAGTKTAIIDLTIIGEHTTVDQWYQGMLMKICEQLSLRQIDVEHWWQANRSISPSQRFIEFLKDLVLPQVPGRVAIFVDEIDSTLALDFSDDFFAAIRAVYNARPRVPVFERLVFILLGVATPTDLMKDRRRTPFNIGKHIDLNQFKKIDIDREPTLRRWLTILNATYPAQGRSILEHVFEWTNGHPYLTQKVCSLIVDQKPYHKTNWTKTEIDELVDREILSDKWRNDENVQFVNDKVLTHPQKATLLQLYKHIYSGETVPDDKRSTVHNQLKLTGLVIADGQGNLRVSNRIYHAIFDEAWINRNLITNWTQHAVIGGITLVIILLVVIFVMSLFNQFTTGTPESTTPIVPTATDSETPNGTTVPTNTVAEAIVTPSITPISSTIMESSVTPTEMAPTEETVLPTETSLPNVAISEAPVYIAPSINFEQLGTVKPGEPVELLGRSANGEFIYILAPDDTRGFASRNLFDLGVDFDSLPVEETPRIAYVIDAPTLYAEPDADSTQIRNFIPQGQSVEVLGRSDLGTWLYIRTSDSEVGFAFIENFLDWPGSEQELQELEVFP